MTMKWGRKKPPSSSSSSSSSRLPLLSRVLPNAWLSTFKRMSIHSEPKPSKEKQQVMRNSVSVSSSKFAGGRERFYGGDDEAFWRLSFGEDAADGKTRRSAWNDTDKGLDFDPSSCRSCGSNAMKIKEKVETKKFINTAFNLEKIEEFRRGPQILPEMKMYGGEEATVIKTPRSRMITEKNLKKANERAVKDKRLKRQNKSGEAEQKSVAKNTLEPEVRAIPMTERENQKLTGDYYQRMHQHMSTLNLRTSNLATTNEDCAFTTQKVVETDVLSPEKLSSKVRMWNEMKFEKVKVKSEEQRKSLYISRELPRKRAKQINKVRAFSPRTASRVEICKIKALEDMKKAKLKMKAAKKKTIIGKIGLEDFAMVKCSYDPKKDFRDSMIEMIMEKRISEPEELEELLACYLTLNSDVYHDLIIEVFQQVWFDLDQGSSDTCLLKERCSCD